MALTCGSGDFAPNGEAIVSIRPHQIVMGTPGNGEGGNRVTGTVDRAVYLGAQRHYLVALDSGTRLQVLTPSGTIAKAGERVGLSLPERHCRALSR